MSPIGMEIADINYLLALGTLALQVITIVILALFVMRNQEGFQGQVSFVRRWALLAAFIVVSAASVFALLYQFHPCPLCWLQRVCMYPIAIMLGMALLREKYIAAAIDFSLVFSMIGAAIAIYQHVLQVMPMSGLPCPASGASCAQLTLFEFGYITYPLMALTVFAFVIVALLFQRKGR